MINLFTTIDESWLPYACMMLESIRRTTEEPVSYWILHENIRQPLQEKVTRWAEKRLITIRFVHLNSLGVKLPQSGIYAKSTVWGRYIPGWVVGPSIERCIYADVDMLAVKSIQDLMTVDLKGESVGAVLCPNKIAADNLGLDGFEYFNNGLLVIDIPKFPGELYIEKMHEIISNQNLIHRAQCAFSLAARGNISEIATKWNVQGQYRAEYSHNARLVHFTGKVKPWHYMSSDPLRETVRDVIRATPFPEAWQPDKSLSMVGYRALRTLRNTIRHFRI